MVLTLYNVNYRVMVDAKSFISYLYLIEKFVEVKNYCNFVTDDAHRRNVAVRTIHDELSI